jgi:hypothetical protein
MKPMGNNVTLCPHCGCRCYTLNSEQITLTYREIRYVCGKAECGHIFVAALTPVRTLVPSSLPNPDIVIPLGRSFTARRGDPEPDPNQTDMFAAVTPTGETA